DAGASSLATFLAALVAARTLTAAEMGAYTLVFAAWTLATQVPSQLIYASAEAKLVSVDPGLRSAHLAANLRHSLPWSAVALRRRRVVPGHLPRRVGRGTDPDRGGDGCLHPRLRRLDPGNAGSEPTDLRVGGGKARQRRSRAAQLSPCREPPPFPSMVGCRSPTPARRPWPPSSPRWSRHGP